MPVPGNVSGTADLGSLVAASGSWGGRLWRRPGGVRVKTRFRGWSPGGVCDRVLAALPQEPAPALALPRRPQEPELPRRRPPEAARLRLLRERQPQQGRAGKSRAHGRRAALPSCPRPQATPTWPSPPLPSARALAAAARLSFPAGSSP